MSHVIHRATYYNTTGASCTWKIDIVDTTISSGSTLAFQTDSSPSIRYSGLPQDLKPGIYPTEYSVRMAIRDVSHNQNGVTWPSNYLWLADLETAAEGRYLLKLYKDDVHKFTGVILPDQCQYEDQDYPFYLTIQAADGLYRLSSEDYVSEVGLINYHTLSADSHNSFSEFSSIPLTVGLTGTEWIMIEHFSEAHITDNPVTSHSSRRTTYARYEQYSIDSPGVGWVDQGGALWAKELTYSNEIIVDEDNQYHLTRDIDDTPFRILSDYIKRAMAVIPHKEEYGAVCMYDVCNQWYEVRMHDLTADPFTMVRWSERKFAGKKWSDVVNEILRHFYCRLYYSDGRYHWEQISERSYDTIDRHCYDYAGTFIETEAAVDLDLDYTALEIQTTTGGSFKSLAPLKKVKINVELSGNNLIANTKWDYENQGSRYLGRLKKIEADTRFLISIDSALGGRFSPLVLGTMPATLQGASTALRAVVVTRLRVVNIDTGVTTHLTPVSSDNHAESTWETDAAAGYFEKTMTVAGCQLPIHVAQKIYKFQTLTDDLPGDLNHSFDVYFSISVSLAFGIPPFAQIWTVLNPTEYELFYIQSAEKSMTTVDVDKEPVNSNQAKVYEVLNDTNNSLSIEMEAKFCDTGMDDDSIEILWDFPGVIGNVWVKSIAWNRNGVEAGAVELLQLLAQEIMSLRVVPRKVYSGGFMTTLMSVANTITRSTYRYLPLSVTIDTDLDEIKGEFVVVARTEPDPAEVIEIAADIDEVVGIAVDDPAGDPDPVIPLGFETNEDIAESAVLTECDIINTYEIHVASGEVVTVTVLATGVQTDLTLTQEILPDDVIMYFEEHTFLTAIPDGSPITVQYDGGGLLDYTREYRYSAYEYVGYFHHAPTYRFPDPTLNSVSSIDQRIEILRNGVRMYFRVTPTGTMEYGINYAAKTFTFPVPFDGEYIQIKAKI